MSADTFVPETLLTSLQNSASLGSAVGEQHQLCDRSLVQKAAHYIQAGVSGKREKQTVAAAGMVAHRDGGLSPGIVWNKPGVVS